MIPLPIHYMEIEDVYARTLGTGIFSLAISGINDGEGVSTLAYALARYAAAMGRKTLLVDFNRRNPSVGQRLGIPSTHWFPGDESAHDNIVALSQTGLSILPAPTVESDWLRVRGTHELRDCFNNWQNNFDCIVADTSPLTVCNQENIPPENVCAACDGAVVVVQTGQTSETSVMEACGKLNKTNAHLLGTVLNDRHAPGLADELIRETKRFDGVAPKFMKKVRNMIQNSTFLNQAI
ncbi:MAG: capsular biosynthesis protein [Rhodospirillaceae bacterium]|nr:MAG: capsular biosynthesis protein [Rhodospirillaceae bacterium]